MEYNTKEASFAWCKLKSFFEEIKFGGTYVPPTLVQITTFNSEPLFADVAGPTWCPPSNDNTFGALQPLPSHFSRRYSVYIKMFFDFIFQCTKEAADTCFIKSFCSSKTCLCWRP